MGGIFQTQHGILLLLLFPLVGPVFLGPWFLDPTFLLLLPDGGLDHGFQDLGSPPLPPLLLIIPLLQILVLLL